MPKHHIESGRGAQLCAPTQDMTPSKNGLVQRHLLTPFQCKLLTKSLETDLSSEYRQRIEIMLLADQGYSQTQICKVLGCRYETARYWIAIAQSGQAHRWNEHRIGRPKVADEQYLNRLKELASHSPREYGYSFPRWTAQWLSKHLAKETGTRVCERHVNRLLKAMGLSTRGSKSTELVGNCVVNTNSNSRLVIGNLQASSEANFLRELPVTE